VNTVQAVFLVGVHATQGAQQKHIPILSLLGGLQIRHGRFYLLEHNLRGRISESVLSVVTNRKARGVAEGWSIERMPRNEVWCSRERLFFKKCVSCSFTLPFPRYLPSKENKRGVQPTGNKAIHLLPFHRSRQEVERRPRAQFPMASSVLGCAPRKLDGSRNTPTVMMVVV